MTKDQRIAILERQIADLQRRGAICGPRRVVAWLHSNHRTAYVITDRVKDVWLRVDPSHVEYYTIPLYEDPLWPKSQS